MVSDGLSTAVRVCDSVNESDVDAFLKTGEEAQGTLELVLVKIPLVVDESVVDEVQGTFAIGTVGTGGREDHSLNQDARDIKLPIVERSCRARTLVFFLPCWESTTAPCFRRILLTCACTPRSLPLKLRLRHARRLLVQSFVQASFGSSLVLLFKQRPNSTPFHASSSKTKEASDDPPSLRFGGTKIWTLGNSSSKPNMYPSLQQASSRKKLRTASIVKCSVKQPTNDPGEEQESIPTMALENVSTLNRTCRVFTRNGPYVALFPSVSTLETLRVAAKECPHARAILLRMITCEPAVPAADPIPVPPPPPPACPIVPAASLPVHVSFLDALSCASFTLTAHTFRSHLPFQDFVTTVKPVLALRTPGTLSPAYLADVYGSCPRTLMTLTTPADPTMLAAAYIKLFHVTASVHKFVRRNGAAAAGVVVGFFVSPAQPVIRCVYVDALLSNASCTRTGHTLLTLLLTRLVLPMATDAPVWLMLEPKSAALVHTYKHMTFQVGEAVYVFEQVSPRPGVYFLALRIPPQHTVPSPAMEDLLLSLREPTSAAVLPIPADRRPLLRDMESIDRTFKNALDDVWNERETLEQLAVKTWRAAIQAATASCALFGVPLTTGIAYRTASVAVSSVCEASSDKTLRERLGPHVMVLVQV